MRARRSAACANHANFLPPHHVNAGLFAPAAALLCGVDTAQNTTTGSPRLRGKLCDYNTTSEACGMGLSYINQQLAMNPTGEADRRAIADPAPRAMPEVASSFAQQC